MHIFLHTKTFRVQTCHYSTVLWQTWMLRRDLDKAMPALNSAIEVNRTVMCSCLGGTWLCSWCSCDADQKGPRQIILTLYRYGIDLLLLTFICIWDKFPKPCSSNWTTVVQPEETALRGFMLTPQISVSGIESVVQGWHCGSQSHGKASRRPCGWHSLKLPVVLHRLTRAQCIGPNA